MKVLLDENLPHGLRNHLPGHEVFTVHYQGWSGLKNGELVQTAENDGFEVFLTGDQTMFYEQKSHWPANSRCGFVRDRMAHHPPQPAGNPGCD